MLLKFAGIWFVIGVATQDTTLTPTGSYRWIMGYTRWYNFSRSQILETTYNNRSICTTTESSTISGQIDAARQIQSFYKQSIHTLSIFSIRNGSRNHKCSWPTDYSMV